MIEKQILRFIIFLSGFKDKNQRGPFEVESFSEQKYSRDIVAAQVRQFLSKYVEVTVFQRLVFQRTRLMEKLFFTCRQWALFRGPVVLTIATGATTATFLEERRFFCIFRIG